MVVIAAILDFALAIRPSSARPHDKPEALAQELQSTGSEPSVNLTTAIFVPLPAHSRIPEPSALRGFGNSVLATPLELLIGIPARFL
jgi:hypothetical protein